MKNGKQIQPSTYIIIAFAILSLVVIGVIVLFYNINNSSSPEASDGDTNQNEYVDPNNGETIVNPKGKSPETDNINPDMPIYIGFSNLYDYGISQDAVESTKSILNDYASQRIANKQEKLTEISINVDSIRHTIDQNTSENTYTYDVKANRKDTFHIQAVLHGLDSMTVTVYTTDIKTPLFVQSDDFPVEDGE